VTEEEKSPVTLLVIGAGNRGRRYSSWTTDPTSPDCGRARVVGVAEPDPVRRSALASAHGIAAEHRFATWQDAAARPRLADAVLITTPDVEHVEPAVAFARLGYHILLEKPIAPTPEGCQRVVDAVREAGVLFAVAHVLRYTPYTSIVRDIVASGRLGEIVSVQHLEPVGFWHQAHSYVRGNWRRSDRAAPMLLAKSCHDLDWLEYVIGRPIRKVSSFGRLTHFTPANRPPGAADRCVECPVEGSCAYSAPRVYLGLYRSGERGWPLNVLVPEVTEPALTAALRDGPYGRCVYACDNDVVDHQVVAMEFDQGATGVFTMTGFNAGGPRRTQIFGTEGELSCNGVEVTVTDFLSGRREVFLATETDAHLGGDEGLMAAFVQAVAAGDASLIRSGPMESLRSHQAVFAAERARMTGTVITL